jgi:Transposase/Protein of unknown function (DUF3631)
VLKEHAAGVSAGDVCRKYGISDATFYKWRSRYGGMEISDARKLKALVFAPLAVSAIGMLPLPLMHRAVVINMQRPAKADTPLQELDERDPMFAAAHAEIQKWAATCALREPEMPPELRNRAADNWRVLLAIADDLGHGAAARAAAVALGTVASTRTRALYCSTIPAACSTPWASTASPAPPWSRCCSGWIVCGTTGAVRRTIAQRASSTRVNWRVCCVRSIFGQARSGRHNDTLTPRAAAAINATNSKPPGRLTVPRPTQRHKPVKSYGY